MTISNFDDYEVADQYHENLIVQKIRANLIVVAPGVYRVIRYDDPAMVHEGPWVPQGLTPRPKARIKGKRKATSHNL